jgi:hypothetical protein
MKSCEFEPPLRRSFYRHRSIGSKLETTFVEIQTQKERQKDRKRERE